MRWSSITYICFLSSLLIFGFYWFLMPDLSLSTSTAVYHNNFSLFSIENQSQAIMQIFLGIFGLIYLKIIWRLINPPRGYK